MIGNVYSYSDELIEGNIFSEVSCTLAFLIVKRKMVVSPSRVNHESVLNGALALWRSTHHRCFMESANDPANILASTHT